MGNSESLISIETWIPTNIVDRQKNSLNELYDFTKGSEWSRNTNWKSIFSPIKDWEGITTNDDGSVIKIILNLNKLSGLIAFSLFFRYMLKVILGYIPPSISGLLQLQRLRINGNNNLIGIC